MEGEQVRLGPKQQHAGRGRGVGADDGRERPLLLPGLFGRLNDREHHSPPDEHGSNLSFLLAGSLPLDLDFKQNLLSTLSEARRLEAVIGYLEAVLPGLRRASKARWN